MQRWNRAQHYVEAIRLAEEVRDDPSFNASVACFPLDRKLALAQFHITVAAASDSVWSGISGHRKVQRNREKMWSED
jgi:hypothetical protein